MVRVVLGGSWKFLVFFLWFLVVLGVNWWFLRVLCSSWWFLVVLDVLVGSGRFLVVLGGS